ncbi:MAG: mevalonate kinase [Myxococcales bacterium]
MGFGHGKVILFGEHAVVHGRPALAAALSLGAEAEAVPAAEASLEVSPWGVRLRADEPGPDGKTEMLRRAYRALLEGYEPWPRMAVRARLSVPGGAGLGGSAALSVAIVRALDAALGIERSDHAVGELAQRAERVFHGNPSGVDAAMAAHGGVGLFRKGEGIRPVRLSRPLPLVVGYSGEHGSTKQTVASVGRQLQRDPKKVEQIFDGMEAIVNNGKLAVETGALSDLGQLMVLNQRLLASLLLSTPRLEEMCAAAIDAGALGAKLTGGGGGGCMIAMCESEEAAQPVLAALKAQDREAFYAEVSP